MTLKIVEWPDLSRRPKVAGVSYPVRVYAVEPERWERLRRRALRRAGRDEGEAVFLEWKGRPLIKLNLTKETAPMTTGDATKSFFLSVSAVGQDRGESPWIDLDPAPPGLEGWTLSYADSLTDQVGHRLIRSQEGARYVVSGGPWGEMPGRVTVAPPLSSTEVVERILPS